jgi:hypothetical protein
MTALLARRFMSSALASTDPVWRGDDRPAGGGERVEEVEGKATRRDGIPRPRLTRRYAWPWSLSPDGFGECGVERRRSR